MPRRKEQPFVRSTGEKATLSGRCYWITSGLTWGLLGRSHLALSCLWLGSTRSRKASTIAMPAILGCRCTLTYMIEMDIDVCYNMNIIVHLIHLCILPFQGCVFTKDINKAIMISDAMETGTVQINSAPARGPDHFPFQVLLPCHWLGLPSFCSIYLLLSSVVCNFYGVWTTGLEGQWDWIPGDN